VKTLNRQVELFDQIMLPGLILIKMLPVLNYAVAVAPWRQRRRVVRFDASAQ
jgi:hypothetical protein